MNPKRLALVGVGGWGRNIARTLSRVRGAVFYALCDFDSSAVAAAHDIDRQTRRVAQFGDVANDPEVDAVIIATPTETHYRLAAEAIQAGKDVFVEKPFTLRIDEAQELVSLADRHNRTLMVGHLLVYHPALEKLRAILKGGELGEIRYLYSQRLNLGVIRTAENALWSLAPHDVAVVMDLLEEVPGTVTAQGAAYVREGIEDVVFLQLHFQSGRMAAIHVSWLDPHKERKLTIVGTKKMAVFDDMEPTEKLRIYDRGVNRPDYASYAEALTLRFGDILIPKVDSAEPLLRECQHFVDRLHDRAAPRSDGRSGLQVVRVLAAASESLRRGGAQTALPT